MEKIFGNRLDNTGMQRTERGEAGVIYNMTHLWRIRWNARVDQGLNKLACRHGNDKTVCRTWEIFGNDTGGETQFGRENWNVRPVSPLNDVQKCCRLMDQGTWGKEKDFDIIREICDERKGRKLFSNQQCEDITRIYQHLLVKTKKLVEKTKKSRFKGFFSPRKLRNKINWGKFSNNIWSFKDINTRTLSPSNMIVPSSNENTFTTPIYRNMQKETLNINKILNRTNLRLDSLLNTLKGSRNLKKNKHSSNRCKSKRNREQPIIDDDYFYIQQNVKSNFAL